VTSSITALVGQEMGFQGADMLYLWVGGGGGDETDLGASHAAALGPVADHLTAVAGAELAPRGVPHVSVVSRGAPVRAAPRGGGALAAALSGSLHFGLTLQEGGGQWGGGFGFIWLFMCNKKQRDKIRELMKMQFFGYCDSSKSIYFYLQNYSFL